MLPADLRGTSPEIEILCRFDYYQDGDWEQAPRAYLIARNHGLAIPDWTLPEVDRAIRALCGLPVAPRPKGQNARGRAYQTRLNNQARMAALDAAKICGLKGDGRFSQACVVLNREGIPTAEATLKGTYKKRYMLRQLPSYALMVPMFIEDIRALQG
jgi:hypothetical protein